MKTKSSTKKHGSRRKTLLEKYFSNALVIATIFDAYKPAKR